MNTAEMIAAGGKFTPLDPALIQEVDTCCAVTGERITRGVATKHVISVTTSDVADTFRFGAYTSVPVATVFADSTLTGNIWADEHELAYPVVSLANKTPERPAWTHLLREIEGVRACVAVFTLNTKRRLWHKAKVSTVGTHWTPFFCDGDVERSLTVDYDALIGCLNFIEKEVLPAGFTKKSIAEGLLFPSSLAIVRKIGLVVARRMENELSRWRTSDELTLALFAAQKTGDAS
jgi:hypothetical protein